jgi:biotin-(acetyl-CoA carboxylase) ligase
MRRPSGILNQAPSMTALDLPPPFRMVWLREAGDAYAHAQAIAAQEGAGTLVHVGRFDLAEFAVVLEPDEPLASARLVFYAGMCALGDALATHAPPQKPVTFAWPDAIRVDGGLVGGGRLGWPAATTEQEVPRWLVFGAMIRTAAIEPESSDPQLPAAALGDEGFADLGPGRLAESFARHLMSGLDGWRNQGFDTLARNYLARMDPDLRGRCDLDRGGDLMIRDAGAVTGRRELQRALLAPSWFDPDLAGPLP